MKDKPSLQYTIRGVPERVDQLLRDKAVREKRSINDAALDALAKGVGATREEIRYHDLDDLSGTWKKDPAFDQAIRDMDQVDPSLWK